MMRKHRNKLLGLGLVFLAMGIGSLLVAVAKKQSVKDLIHQSIPLTKGASIEADFLSKSDVLYLIRLDFEGLRGSSALAGYTDPSKWISKVQSLFVEEIDVQWEVFSGGKLETSSEKDGSFKDRYPAQVIGMVTGKFKGQKNKIYTVKLEVKKTAKNLGTMSPHLVVAVDSLVRKSALIESGISQVFGLFSIVVGFIVIFLALRLRD